MTVVAQSQPPKYGYIHLAYVSAQLSNGISKGELISVQSGLGLAVAAAVVIGSITRLVAGPGRRARWMVHGAIVGALIAGVFYWVANSLWLQTRSHEQVVSHIISTRQFWALRDKAFALHIEAAAETNGVAASMAASYYGLTGRTMSPESVVKAYRFLDLANAQGQQSRHFYINLDEPELAIVIENALKAGKLSDMEQSWAREKLAQISAP
jgi:hypothetical protein